MSQATFRQAVTRLDERGIRHSGVKDRGFMDSIYFDDPLGLLVELVPYGTLARSEYKSQLLER